MSAAELYPDAFVKVSLNEVDAEKQRDPAAEPWYRIGSATHMGTEINLLHELKAQYPGHAVVLTRDSVLGTPGALIKPISQDDLVMNVFFAPFPRRSERAGILAAMIQFAGFHLNYRDHDYLVYTIQYQKDLRINTQQYILHDGTRTPIYELLYDSGAVRRKIYSSVLVFEQGFWWRDALLWRELQSADWEDVILEEDFKESLRQDVYNFFGSEKLYQQYKLPWKRGIIMYGPPGDGKTITVKALMKDCDMMGYVPMYVKSFKSRIFNEEECIANVFVQARAIAPCLLVFEDLDSLINSENRSVFLNQLDGIAGSEGVVVLATTNHFDRLDEGIADRPSRFDRKFLFDDPERHARLMYARYWQDKLKESDNLKFPDSLASEVADNTEGFSFAYLKEVFVSALTAALKAHEHGRDVVFAELIRAEIRKLREQIDGPTHDDSVPRYYKGYTTGAWLTSRRQAQAARPKNAGLPTEPRGVIAPPKPRVPDEDGIFSASGVEQGEGIMLPPEVQMQYDEEFCEFMKSRNLRL
ncbi:P-loop containing nucleoside triphosphate hydrolase protein [Peniophora sp. CONT]|nr:P-loop containing nucleoside triphosphate hydrolase protein [Peniophora sp. CONT]